MMHRQLQAILQQAEAIKSAGYIQYPADFDIKSALDNIGIRYRWCRNLPEDEPFYGLQIDEEQFFEVLQPVKNDQTLYRIEKQIADASLALEVSSRKKPNLVLALPSKV